MAYYLVDLRHRISSAAYRDRKKVEEVLDVLIARSRRQRLGITYDDYAIVSSAKERDKLLNDSM